MDYCGLNYITRKDRYLLPLIKEILISILQVIYFITLHITVVFYKICIAKEQEWIIVFRINYKLFEYLAILFGFIKTPATF